MKKEWKLFKPVKDEPSEEADDVYCADCGRRLCYTLRGKRIYTLDWFTCAYCGEPICEKCREKHIPLCMVLTWGKGEIDEETGELVITDEKPEQFAM